LQEAYVSREAVLQRMGVRQAAPSSERS
jgi:hypothetical protein